MDRILIEEILVEERVTNWSTFQWMQERTAELQSRWSHFKKPQLQSTEMGSAMKQHWTWLASLLSPNSNKRTLFFPSRQQTLAHIFRETPVRAEELRDSSRGGHRDPVNHHGSFWSQLFPAPPQLNANSYTDSTDASCSPRKSYKRMFRHIP